jgi:hypothetical protein
VLDVSPCAVSPDAEAPETCADAPFPAASSAAPEFAAGIEDIPPNLPINRPTHSRTQSTVSIRKCRNDHAVEQGSAFLLEVPQSSGGSFKSSVGRAFRSQDQTFVEAASNRPVLPGRMPKDNIGQARNHEKSSSDSSYIDTGVAHGPFRPTLHRSFHAWLQGSCSSAKTIAQSLIRQGIQLLPFQIAPDQVCYSASDMA